MRFDFERNKTIIGLKFAVTVRIKQTLGERNKTIIGLKWSSSCNKSSFITGT